MECRWRRPPSPNRPVTPYSGFAQITPIHRGATTIIQVRKQIKDNPRDDPIMAIGKEVADLISAFERLLARIEQGFGYTEEEHKAINDMARMIDLVISLYRLKNLPASDTRH